MSKKEDISPIDLETADIFLKKLYEVIYKLSSISKTQFPRFKKLWNIYFAQDFIKPHIPRQIPFDKQKFLKDDDNKAKTLRITEKAAVDIFYSIRSIVEVLYNEYGGFFLLISIIFSSGIFMTASTVKSGVMGLSIFFTLF